MLFERKDFIHILGFYIDFSYAWLSWGRIFKDTKETRGLLVDEGWYCQIKFPIPYIQRIPDMYQNKSYEEACFPVIQFGKWRGERFYRRLVKVLSDYQFNSRQGVYID